MIREKVIQIYAPLRGEPELVRLRLEALRPPQEPGYEVVIYRPDTIAVEQRTDQAEVHAPRTRERRVWTRYDTVRSDRPTADQALQQVLGFLELRCA